jgi:pimeloyl-ACP methyl ester carboxylesterase
MNTKNSLIFFTILFTLFTTPFIATAQFSFDPPAPNWSINFEWDGNNVTENGLYEFALNQGKASSYSWQAGAPGQIYGEIYKGELNNAVLTATHLFDSLGAATTTDVWLSEGNYFVVVYNLNTSCGSSGDICFLPKLKDIQEWFKSGFSFSNFFSSPPQNWGIINFTVVAQTQNNSPALSYSSEDGYANDTTSQGIEPNKGTADKTEMTFKVVYTDDDNDTPSTMDVIVGNGVSTTTLPMLVDIEATATLNDGNFTNGEQYFATSTFSTGKYQYYFMVSDGTDTVRLPAQTDIPTTLSFQTGYSNIVFLPGMQASRLYEDRTFFDNKLWEPGLSDNISTLYLNPDGTSKNSDIYSKSIIGAIDIPLLIGGPNIYKEFKMFMNKMVSDGIINQWQALPYDWRLGLEEILASGKDIGSGKISYLQSTSTPYILQELAQLAETSQNGKVTIITHSNGGLLAKILLKQLEDSDNPLLDKIDKLILVAVPQLGTPQAIVELLHGGNPGFFSKMALNKKDRREFSENMASVYNLLPSQKYFSVVDTDAQPIVQFSTTTSVTANFRALYGDFIETQSELRSFLLGADGRTKPAISDVNKPNIANSRLFAKASIVQTTLDSWTPPVDMEVVQIAGWGVMETIRGVEYVEVIENICNQDNSACLDTPVLDPQPLWTQDGDGTVVTASAIGLDASMPVFYVNNFNHNEELGGGRRNRKHADILEIDELRTLLGQIIQGSVNLLSLPKHISTTIPDVEDSTYRLVLRSPVSIDIYDSFGNHTGVIPNPDPNSSIALIEEQIPNSYYMEFGEGKYVGLGASDEYRIEMQGENLGTFTFELEEVLGDEIVNTVVYENIPVTALTTATLNLQNLDTTPELALDIDGDGTTDVVLTGGEEDIQASFEILAGIIDTMDIHKGLKKELRKKLKKVEKELKRGRTKKAVKHLNKIIEKLEKEIRKNTKSGEKEEHEEDEHKKHKKEKSEKHKDTHDKNKHHEKKERKDHDDKKKEKKIKISTENAQSLIFMVKRLKNSIINI